MVVDPQEAQEYNSKIDDIAQNFYDMHYNLQLLLDSKHKWDEYDFNDWQNVKRYHLDDILKLQYKLAAKMQDATKPLIQ